MPSDTPVREMIAYFLILLMVASLFWVYLHATKERRAQRRDARLRRRTREEDHARQDAAWDAAM